MKNKDLFATYDDAWHCYYDVVVPQYGATRLEYGFGRWLWLDAVEPVDDAAIVREWHMMKDAGILTNDGLKKLARYEKNTERLNAYPALPKD